MRKSKKEKQWLRSFNIKLIKQYKILLSKKKYIFVDGFDPKTNTVYEFYGDYWHGNPKTKDKNKLNIKLNKTFGKLYKETIKREKLIKKAGYKLIAIWESDFIHAA